VSEKERKEAGGGDKAKGRMSQRELPSWAGAPQLVFFLKQLEDVFFVAFAED